METNELLASCPNCKASLKVTVGRMSTCRTATCRVCGHRYDYSAWKLKTVKRNGPLDLATFYKVEFVELGANHV